MITALQTRLTCALDEFKREQKLKENVRRISLMRNQLPLLDDDLNPSLSDEFDELDYTPLRKHADNQLDNLSQLSISSDSKGSSFQQMYRHLSQASLTSLRSKSSTSSSRKSVPMYEPNHAMPLRKQLLLKGSKNFKEPLERTKSAPKLGSILEELSSDDEDNFFGESFSFTEEQFATQDLQSQESHDSETIDLMSPQNDIVRAVSYKNNPDTCSNNENFERLFQQSSNLLAQLTRSQSTCRSAEHNERALCDQFQHILLDQRPHLNQCDT